MLTDKVLNGTVVAALRLFRKQTAWQLPRLAVIGDTVAANALARARFIGAIAPFRVGFRVRTVGHLPPPTAREATKCAGARMAALCSFGIPRCAVNQYKFFRSRGETPLHIFELSSKMERMQQKRSRNTAGAGDLGNSARPGGQARPDCAVSLHPA